MSDTERSQPSEAEAIEEHADNWRTAPPGEQVPEWLDRRNDDQDSPPAEDEGDANPAG